MNRMMELESLQDFQAPKLDCRLLELRSNLRHFGMRLKI